jgi:hypothetical protein
VVAQAVLCKIFWQWGNRTMEDAVDNEAFPTIETDEFDDDDLMALIWNTLVKKRADEIENNFLVRSSRSKKDSASNSDTLIQREDDSQDP